MWVSGVMTSSMGRGKRTGIMGRSGMLVLSTRERRMGRGSSCGKMEAFMKETLWMGTSKDMVCYACYIVV